MIPVICKDFQDMFAPFIILSAIMFKTKSPAHRCRSAQGERLAGVRHHGPHQVQNRVKHSCRN